MVGSIADRRDFYHQFKVSDEKAAFNAMYPTFITGAAAKSSGLGEVPFGFWYFQAAEEERERRRLSSGPSEAHPDQ